MHGVLKYLSVLPTSRLGCVSSCVSQFVYVFVFNVLRVSARHLFDELTVSRIWKRDIPI